MLEALLSPAGIAILLVVLVALIGFVVLRRRRAQNNDATPPPPPEIGQTIDYTSLPVEEPQTLGDRFRSMSPAGKLLTILGPLMLIGLIVAVVVILLQPPPEIIPPPPTVKIENVTARLTNANRILVRAETNLPEGATVNATLQENGTDFLWFLPESAQTTVSGGRVSLNLDRDPNGPIPQQGQEYQVLVTSALADGSVVRSELVAVEIPSVLTNGFFAIQPTAAPTPAPTAVPSQQPPQPTAAATPTVEAVPVTVTATVSNGGNIRAAPNLNGQVLGQLVAGQEVTLFEKSADGFWYRLQAPNGTGWASATLINVSREDAERVPLVGQGAQVPTSPPPTAGANPTFTPDALTATVFNGGRIRSTPTIVDNPSNQVGTINANETVQLLAKTANGSWYKITDIRGVTGWVSVTLLTISADVADQVPVE
jgi:flagellar FliL protein